MMNPTAGTFLLLLISAVAAQGISLESFWFFIIYPLRWWKKASSRSGFLWTFCRCPDNGPDAISSLGSKFPRRSSSRCDAEISQIPPAGLRPRRKKLERPRFQSVIQVSADWRKSAESRCVRTPRHLWGSGAWTPLNGILKLKTDLVFCQLDMI